MTNTEKMAASIVVVGALWACFQAGRIVEGREAYNRAASTMASWSASGRPNLAPPDRHPGISWLGGPGDGFWLSVARPGDSR